MGSEHRRSEARAWGLGRDPRGPWVCETRWGGQAMGEQGATGDDLDRYQPRSAWWARPHGAAGIHGLGHCARVLLWANHVAQRLAADGKAVDRTVGAGRPPATIAAGTMMAEMPGTGPGRAVVGKNAALLDPTLTRRSGAGSAVGGDLARSSGRGVPGLDARTAVPGRPPMGSTACGSAISTLATCGCPTCTGGRTTRGRCSGQAPTAAPIRGR